ncbi:MAG: inositol monophosphatase [Lachnospiraceae bacterium]|nr:inositol monophosphatase [Lachnospiraceae bacterium]
MKIDQKKVAEIVRSARELFENHEKARHIKAKGDKDFVTEVDTAVQKYMKERLSGLYPDIQMMGEEKDNADVDVSGDFWVIDPVDGTTNLIHDFRFSALSLGYVEAGEAVFGAVYQPYTDELFIAERGKGAFLNGRQIHVSSAEKLRDSLVLFGTDPYVRGELSRRDFEGIIRVFEECVDIRRTGSAALDLCYVAAGRCDAFFERSLNPWDYAAGTVLVREAGGTVVDFEGRDVDVRFKGGAVATNGKLTKELLGYLQI